MLDVHLDAFFLFPTELIQFKDCKSFLIWYAIFVDSRGINIVINRNIWKRNLRILIIRTFNF